MESLANDLLPLVKILENMKYVARRNSQISFLFPFVLLFYVIESGTGIMDTFRPFKSDIEF